MANTTANTLPGSSQSWDLDSIGNQQSVTTDGTAATNTQNSQNELTNFNGFTLSYDNAGNMTMDQNGNVMSYDAWNRLISDGSLTTSLATVYTYDANGNRITEQQTAIADQGPILVVNNGTAQRSMIDSLTLVFDHPVTISSGAITLAGVTNGDITISVTNPSGDGKTYLITFSGDEISAGSLPNDVYTLSVSASGVTNVSNGEATLSSDATYVFARLVGDANGDGTIDTADVTALEATYGNLTNPAMDFYGDGTVGFDDLSLMAQTSGDSVTFTPGSGRIMVAPWTTASTAGDISSWVAGPVTDVYFDSLGQAIEERQGSIVTAQYVWNIDYQNDLLLRDDNSVSGSLGKSGSGLGQRLYSQHDANFNVTALVDNSGNVVERFVYTPYGVQTVLTASWVATTDTYGVLYGFQGGRMDPATGLIHFGTRGRDYDPATGTWLQQDPAGYVDGLNDRISISDDPVGLVDPNGTDPIPPGGFFIGIDPNYLQWLYNTQGQMPDPHTSPLPYMPVVVTATIGANVVTGVGAGMSFTAYTDFDDFALTMNAGPRVGMDVGAGFSVGAYAPTVSMNDIVPQQTNSDITYDVSAGMGNLSLGQSFSSHNSPSAGRTLVGLDLFPVSLSIGATPTIVMIAPRPPVNAPQPEGKKSGPCPASGAPATPPLPHAPQPAPQPPAPQPPAPPMPGFPLPNNPFYPITGLGF